LHRRKFIASKTLETKGRDPRAKADVAVWKFLAIMLEKLGQGGMSSDSEGDYTMGRHQESVWCARPLPWRNSSLSYWLRIVDDAGGKLKISGPKARARFRDSDKELSDIKGDEWAIECMGRAIKVKEGLPRAFYNPAWLEEREKVLPGHARTTLRVTKEEFNCLDAAFIEMYDSIHN
jgi:hypothetical protein